MPRVLITRKHDFGWALEMLKLGKRVYRAGWNASGQWVYFVPAASYPAQTNAAKARFGKMVPYRAYFALVTKQGDVAVWTPSTSDCLADDWMEAHEGEQIPEADVTVASVWDDALPLNVEGSPFEIVPEGTKIEAAVVTGPPVPAQGAQEPVDVVGVPAGEVGPLVRRGAEPVLREPEFREGLRGPDWGGNPKET